MSKRQNTSSPEPDSPRQRPRLSLESDGVQSSNRSDGHEQPLLDVTTGQFGAFPGLTDGDDLFYGPAANGLDYLRMVRSEAKSIPQLLTAKTEQQQYRTSNDDYANYHEGFFEEDEAFIAAPMMAHKQENAVNKIQQAYHESMLVHFRLARATMNCTPPLDRIQGLHPSIPISFPTSSKSARQTWERHVAEHYPHPVQIACMDADSILQLIKLITKRITPMFRSTKEGDVERMGTWIWALLAKFPERGSLGSEEIAELRTFAKRADTLWEWLQNRFVADRDQDQEVGELEDDESETSAQSPEAGNEPADDARDIQQASATEVQEAKSDGGSQLQKQQMILDMVMTVVGEVYGQRDLLEMRRPWVAVDN